MKRLGFSVVALFALFLLNCPTVAAQTAPGVFADANHPAGAPEPQKLDAIWQVDPINDQVSINIPFSTTPQGGRGPKIPFSLLYNSASTVTLQAAGNVIVGYGTPVSIFTWSAHPIASMGSFTAPSGPWTTTGPYFYSSYSNVPNMGFTDTNGNYHVTANGCTITSPYTYVDQEGTSHDSNLVNFSPISGYDQNLGWAPPCGPAQSAAATYWPSSSTSDGSAIQSGSNNITGPDGTAASGSYMTGGASGGASTLGDSNGNAASLNAASGVTTATDALGRTVYKTNVPVGLPGQIPAGSYYVTTYSASGSQETYTVIFSTIAIGSFTMPHPTASEFLSPAFCTSCNSVYTVNQPSAVDKLTAITEIDRPDGTSYKFTYHATYGTISKITFPTGGSVQFTWGIRDKDWSPYSQYSAISSVVVTAADVSDGSVVSHWSYDMNSLSTSSTPIGRVHAPDSSRTDYTGACFVYTPISMYQFQAKASCKEASRAIYNSSGVLLKSVAQNFTSHGLPIQIATSLYDGPSNLQQLVQNVRDGWDNLTGEDESDYYGCSGRPCPGPTQTASLPVPSGGWKRITYTNYAYTTNTAMANAHIVNKPSQVLVTDGGGHPYSLAQFGYDGRGNLTTESPCATLNSSQTVTPSTAAGACSAWASTTHMYDLAGQRLSTKDANNNTTSFSYADNYAEGTPPGQTDGYLTQITYANGLSESFSYDYSSGQMASHTDPNSQVTSYSYNDPGNMSRLTQTTYPDTGNVQFSYNDATPPSVTVTTATGQPQGPIVRTTKYDGLGRVVQTQLTSDPFGTDYVDTAYDRNGRLHSVSNPHRSGSSTSDGTTVYTSYDALDRPLIITNPDGTTTRQFSYAANVVTSLDENGNQWTRTTNGLGQLIYVFEPNGSSQSATMETDYTYNPVGALLNVTQWGGAKNSPGARTRTFTYDGMSRLLTAANPEAGTTTYTYDGNSNVLTKTDARAVKISYAYDKLNRLNWKHYSDGITPASGFGYDGNDATGNPIAPAVTYAKGHLSQLSIVSSQAISNFSFDKMGRLVLKNSCVPGDCTYGIKVAATYDLAGELLTLSNGSLSHPITLTYSYDGAGRVKQITGNPTVNSISTVFQATSTSPASYGPAGLTYALLGVNSSGTAVFSMNRAIDNRLRSMFGGYYNSGGAALYTYCIPGGSNTNCTSSTPGFAPNGNLAKVIDSVTGTWAYTYNTLNRLSTGTVGAQYGCWSYDAFGNRTSESMSATPCNQTPPFSSWANYTTTNSNRMDSTSTNTAQISGYDAAGNVTFDGLNKYLYDGEGRICAVQNTISGAATAYVYDSQGNRVGRGTISSFSCLKASNGFTATAGYVTGLRGEQMTETNGTTLWVHTNVFANGALLATYRDTNLYFAFQDWLGTKRAEGEALSGGAICLNTSYSLPFGNGLTTSGGCPDATEHHFTGKERDTESGNDYFGARYYASSMGRFLSPDPLLSSARPGNPQTWNRYAYARNNPLGRVDPTGLYDMKNTCASGNKACNDAFAKTTANVRSMYASTQAARDKAMASGDKKAAGALQRTLDGLGPEGQKNARGQTVNVSVNLGIDSPGHTTMDKNGTVNVELNPGMSNGDEGVQAAASHEGVHAGEIMPGLSTHAQALSAERDAYETESYFSQAIGFENIHSPSNGSDMVNGVLDMSKDFVIWNPSWAAADAQTYRSRGVEAAAQDGANTDCANGGCKP